jgi:hypothetical protein
VPATNACHRLNDADIEVSPLNAALTVLLIAPIAATFTDVCDALVNVTAGDEAVRAHFLGAVARAQNLATACGLVPTIGQDVVQAIMAQSFKRCRVQHRPPAGPPSQRDQAANSTVEALMYALRERGVDALSERAVLYRLADVSSDQTRDIIRRLIVLRPRYPNVSDALLFKLGELL